MSKAKFSRNNTSSLFGKLTHDLPKVSISEETYLILKKKASEAGMSSLVEYLRCKAEIDAHGLDTINRLQQNRMNKIATMGQERVDK